MLRRHPTSRLFPYTTLFRSIPWREAQNSDFIASLFVERLYGQAAARFVTGMILWIAVASAFSVLLGASRSEEHTSELQSHSDLVCRLLLEKKKILDRQARKH